MGPTTVALLRYFRADQAFRESSRKLEAATRDVRSQEARVAQLKAEYDATHHKANVAESKQKELELELKAREERIEMLRERQSTATDDKAYRALIVDINNLKTDKGKLEEQGLAAIEQLDGLRKTMGDLKSRGDNEAAKLATMKGSVDDKVKALSAEVEAERAPRDAAAAELSPAVLQAFHRAGERYDGEALAAIERPDARDVEYLCTGCNTYLVANIYNRLMSSKDEIVHCPSCGRILFVPDELTPELALASKKPTTTKVAKPKKVKEPKDPNAPKVKRVRKPKALEVGKAPAEPGSIAAAIAAGSGAASGKGFKAVQQTAPSAPPTTRADGSVVAHEDEEAADDSDAESTSEQPASN